MNHGGMIKDTIPAIAQKQTMKLQDSFKINIPGQIVIFKLPKY
jgi:hypothetical protein